MTTEAEVGPTCTCGHGLYEHYMCGAVDKSWCYKGKECGCKQFNPNLRSVVRPLSQERASA